MSSEDKYTVDAFLLGMDPFSRQRRYKVGAASEAGTKRQCVLASHPQQSTTSGSYSWGVVKDQIAIEKVSGTFSGLSLPLVLSMEFDDGRSLPKVYQLFSFGKSEYRSSSQFRLASGLLLLGLILRLIFHHLSITISLSAEKRDGELSDSAGDAPKGHKQNLFIPSGGVSARAIVDRSSGEITIARPRPLKRPSKASLNEKFVVDAVVLGSEVFLAIWSKNDIKVDGAEPLNVNQNIQISLFYPRGFWKEVQRKSEEDVRHSWEAKIRVRLTSEGRNHDYWIVGFPHKARKWMDFISLTVMVAAPIWLASGMLIPGSVGSWDYFLLLLSASIACFSIFLIRLGRIKGWPFTGAKVWVPVCRFVFAILILLVPLTWFWMDHNFSAPSKLLLLFGLLTIALVGLWRLRGKPEEVLIGGQAVSNVEFWMSPALWILPHIK